MESGKDRHKMSAAEKDNYKARLLQIMIGHVGISQAIGMGELYEQVFGEPWAHRINDTRRLRKIVDELRWEGTLILSSPKRLGGGYYIASTVSEATDYTKKLLHKALKLIKKASKFSNVGVPEIMGQLRLDLEMMEK